LYHQLGWRIAHYYVDLLGALYFFLKREEKRRIEEAIASVFAAEKSTSELKSMTRGIFRGIRSHYYEKLFIAFEHHKSASRFLNQNVICENLVGLREKLKKGRGVILVTGHYGAIEYIPTLLAINDFPTSMIAKFKTEHLKKKVYSQAEKYKIRLIDGADTGNVIKSAIRELRENRILITQCDEIEKWRPSFRKKISFLGRTTFLDRTINIIAARTGAEIVFGLIHRYNLSKYRLILNDYIEMTESLEKPSTLSIGETLLKFLELYIYANPEQWYQWNQYLKIKTAPADGRADHRLASPLVLKPAFEKAS